MLLKKVPTEHFLIQVTYLCTDKFSLESIHYRRLKHTAILDYLYLHEGCGDLINCLSRKPLNLLESRINST